VSESYHALTVVLDHDVHEADVEALLTTIRHIRGVLSVQPHVAGWDELAARQRALMDLRAKVIDAMDGTVKV
jgi:hypothetical protein